MQSENSDRSYSIFLRHLLIVKHQGAISTTDTRKQSSFQRQTHANKIHFNDRHMQSMFYCIRIEILQHNKVDGICYEDGYKCLSLRNYDVDVITWRSLFTDRLRIYINTQWSIRRHG